MIPLTPSQATNAITKCLRANKFVMLSGSPGIGKSWIANDIAVNHKLVPIDKRLAQSDPTDLNGFPSLSQDRTRMEYKPDKDFPLEGIDEIPHGYNGWFILFDELNSAPLSVQAAAYKVILDRKIGEHNLHPKAFMMGAGNLQSDRAIVNRLGTAMQSRMVHIHLQVDIYDWQEWANQHDIDHRIRAFLKFRPELLHKFNPDHDDVTYPCPRTWHFLSDIIKPIQEFEIEDLAIIQGTIGEGGGMEFKSYCKIYKNLPTVEDMIAAPEMIEIPDEPSHQYAYATLIGSTMNVDNCAPLMQVMSQLPKEFQIITLKDVYSKGGETKQHPLIRQWVEQNAKRFFDR